MAEYQRVKGILEEMPRYKAGTHNGKPVIRKYTGIGNKTSIVTATSTGRGYSQMQEQLEQFALLNKLLSSYRSELTRRRLTVPAEFSFTRDPSPYSVEAWERLVPCSNSHEIGSKYYDDYGFNVRTRGEMMVGNVLKELGLEAKYEPALVLKGGKKRTPDYAFPVRIIDRCFFIEFMGMANDDGYIESNYGKIEEYMRNGILLSRDLIVISGTKNWLPEQESIKRIITAFINNAVLSVYNHKV